MAEHFSKRTATCGGLTKADDKKAVVLNGWVHRHRDHGMIHFINLRDRYGITQVIVDDDSSKELQQAALSLNLEDCIAVTGVVRARPASMVNPEMATGEIEVKAEKIEILSTCAPLPFQIDDGNVPREELRLKYRYLDLRTEGMKKRIKLRHDMVWTIRRYLSSRGFYEIETPTMIKSTPRGLVTSSFLPESMWASSMLCPRAPSSSSRF